MPPMKSMHRSVARASCACALLSLLLVPACGGDLNEPGEKIDEIESPLVATWTPMSGTTDVTPSPVSFAGKLFLFARGIGDQKVYVRSSTDGSAWSDWNVLSGTTTDVSLAPVVFGSTLYVFARGASDSGIHVNSSTDGNAWSGWSVAFTGTTNVAVAPVVYGGKLHVFVKGINDQTVYVTSSANAHGWSTWLAIPGTTDVAPAAVVFNDQLILFSKGIADHEIYYSTSTNGTFWEPWKQFGGTTATGVRAAVFAGDLYVTAPGLADHRIYVASSRDFIHWTPWIELPPMSRTTHAAVGMTAFANGLYFFALGANDNKIYVESTPVYRLPFTDPAGWNLASGNWDDPHGGHGFGQAYAFDFVHAEGAVVRAIRGGMVIGAASNRTCNVWNVHAGNPCFGQPGEGNYVLIRHVDGTVAAYDHLKANEVFVSVGNQVAAGQTLALSGNTGNSSAPHVHIDVRQYWSSGSDLGPTIPIYFGDSQHAAWRPQDGDAFLP